MSQITNAISRIQTHALACTYPSTDTTPILKVAPDYPAEDASALPFSYAYVGSGEADAVNASTAKFMPKLIVDVHFSRVSIKYSYQLISEFIPQFIKRIAGDPTLNSTVDTVIFPVSWSIGAAQFNSVETIFIRFEIPIKTLETPMA